MADATELLDGAMIQSAAGTTHQDRALVVVQADPDRITVTVTATGLTHGTHTLNLVQRSEQE